jgi:hypothetical protein
MDFVDEKKRSARCLSESARGRFDLLAQLLYSSSRAMGSFGVGAGTNSDHFCERGFPRSRWSRDDHRLERVLLYEPPQKCTRCETVTLTGDLIERSRAHAQRKRRSLRASDRTQR